MQPTHPSHLPLKQWLTAHHISPAERRQFAAGARLSVNNLSQYVNGHRAITPRVAARLEQASLLLRVSAVPIPPPSAKMANRARFVNACVQVEETAPEHKMTARIDA